MSREKNIFEKFPKKWPKGVFARRVGGERGNIDLPSGAKGGEKMDLDRHDEHKQHTFDSFCKKVLREEARNYAKHIAWRSEHEVSLSELSEEQIDQAYILDEYPSDYTQFDVQGYSVTVHDDRLAQALTELPDEKRDILLLSYFLDMTDREIADKLNMVRCTVQRKRVKSLKEMKRRMEVEEDGGQSEE